MDDEVNGLLIFYVRARCSYHLDTEIDWSTYMQQVSCYEQGIRNYSEIKGDTGPVVYPAGHIWFYLILSRITNGGKDIRTAQYVFEFLYLTSLLLVFRIYYMSYKLPPFVLIILCCISYRIHSIYILRLFNDPVAMLFFYLAINFWIGRHFSIGCMFYSLAVSVKMNILLFSPALFFILLLNTGYWNTFMIIILCATIQIVLALPFLLHDPFSYLQKSFDLGRVFLFEWTVNWRFLSEAIFLDHRFHILLLVVHIVLLFCAGYVWFRRYGGCMHMLSILRYSKISLSTNEMLLALFTANLIGISVARSLHYQFYSWYFHTLSYLLFAGLPFNNEWFFTTGVVASVRKKKSNVIQIPKFSGDTLSPLSIILRCCILIGIEICWNTYPSTVVSSAMLHCFHIAVLCILMHDYHANSNVKTY
ncbi:unnamed protein product [Litomosoides sigmodontis]|uniref:dolichyl-P-Man:Man5GlcNAc2-PP-dolichol alpha-1,3-mannosyltransferase n=1 Tax=Litomosoides sigmodontis TaxID=42156 RepID=A0A3P6VD96_LITSI|nr:unnamed protein product [Litomosoides sigmodontis]